MTSAIRRLVDPLLLKKKINKIGNPGEFAVLSSLLCYIISLDGSDGKKATKEELPTRILKKKVHSKEEEQTNNKKAIRPTRFQLLQSKFLNPNHEPPMKKPKEVGKLTFKENRYTAPCSSGSIVKKLDASKLKLSKEEKLENDLHFRTDKNQWNKVTGKGRVKSILNKFAAAEEKEVKNMKPEKSKIYSPKMRSKGTVIESLKEKFEQNSTICSVKVVKHSLVPKEQTVKKEIPVSIKHLRQAEDHMAHTTKMTAMHLEKPVLEYAELSEQTIHTFLPTSMIIKVFTAEAPKPSSKVTDTGELCQNDEYSQVVCSNFSSSYTGGKHLDMQIKGKRGADEGKITEVTGNIKCDTVKDIHQKSTTIYESGSDNRETIDKHPLDTLGTFGHGEMETSEETDLQSERGLNGTTNEVTVQSGINSTSSLHVYASCKDSVPNNISCKDLEGSSETIECGLDVDDGQNCEIFDNLQKSEDNVRGSKQDNNQKEKVLNDQQNFKSYTKRFPCSDKEEEGISNTDTIPACLEIEGPKRLNGSTCGTQNDDRYTQRFPLTDKEEENSDANDMPSLKSESTNLINVPTCEMRNEKSYTIKFQVANQEDGNSNTDIMSACLEIEDPKQLNVSTCGRLHENNYQKRFQWTGKEEGNSNSNTMSACLEIEGPEQMNVSTCERQDDDNCTKRFQWTGKEEGNSNSDTMSACLEIEGPKQMNVSTCETQDDDNYTRMFQWTGKEEGNSNTDNTLLSLRSENTKQLNVPTCELQKDNVFARNTDNCEHTDEKVMLADSKNFIRLPSISETGRNTDIPSKAINPTDSNKKTSDLLPQTTSHQNNSVANKNICKDRNIESVSKYGRCCEFREQEHPTEVIPSILSLTDKATYTMEPYVPFKTALREDIKVHQNISETPSLSMPNEHLMIEQSSAIGKIQKQLNSRTSSQILKPNEFPQAILQSQEPLNQLGSSDLSSRGTKFKKPFPKELPGNQGSFSCAPETENIHSWNVSKQAEGLENEHSSVEVNAQKQMREVTGHKLSVSDNNCLENRKENQLSLASEALIYDKKILKDIPVIANSVPTNHLKKFHTGSNKEIIKNVTPKFSDHISGQGTVASGKQTARNEKFNILPSRMETPTKTIITSKQESTNHSQGKPYAIDQRLTSKYQIPSSRDMASDQLSKASQTQSTNSIPINDLSKYKAQSYKDTTISKQLFKPLVVRVGDTFKHT